MRAKAAHPKIPSWVCKLVFGGHNLASGRFEEGDNVPPEFFGKYGRYCLICSYAEFTTIEKDGSLHSEPVIKK